MARIDPTRVEFQVADPEGRTVRLRTVLWVKHILVLHPLMFSHRDDVQQAVVDPDEIWRQFRADEERLIYCKRTDQFPPSTRLWAVALRERTGRYDIRSAYPALRLPGKGRPIRKKK